MKIFKVLLIVMLTYSTLTFARNGGDDVGNGGFAYRQSVIILKMATKALENKIIDSTLKDIMDYPVRRSILQDTLGYEDLDKFSKKNKSRGGKLLAMDYTVSPASVILYKPYFDAFAGKTDRELEDSSLEVQKRLLHEAAHIWGYKEDAAEKFAVAFLENATGEQIRPTNDIGIKSACSCYQGKSDVGPTCDSFCEKQDYSDQPILYVDTILGPKTTNHSKLGSLEKWCTAWLSEDQTSAQCSLNATDGKNTFLIPVSIENNSFTANLINLKKNKSWVLKLVETKTGSNAQTKEFQIRRMSSTNPEDNYPLEKININQYTCLKYGGKRAPNGDIIRTDYARMYYYYDDYTPPMPIPPGQQTKVCHDEQAHPGSDSSLYPRLESFRSHNQWVRSDRRFVQETTGRKKIDLMIEQRLEDEYDITNVRPNLFQLISYPGASYSDMSLPLGYIMTSFLDSTNGKSFCVNSSNKSLSPILSIAHDYTGDTEGLYFGQDEGKEIFDGTSYRTIYATILINEYIVKQYGFYVQDGLKKRVDEKNQHERRIYFYWPVIPDSDPLKQGSRKLFSVKHPDELNSTFPGSLGPSTERTSDKRIGCIPK